MRIRDLVLLSCADISKHAAVRAGGQRSTMVDQPTMVEILEQMRRHVRAYLPPEIADRDNEVIGALAVIVSLLAFIGEDMSCS